MRRALIVLAAVAAALAVWTVADPVLGAELDVRLADDDPVDRVEARAVALTTVVAGLLAWALLELLERRGRSGRRTWTALAAGVAALSLLGPILGGLTTAATIGLIAIHLAASAVLIGLLPR